MRKLKWAAGVAAIALTGGCEDLATGMAMYADQLDAEQGNYYPDQHFSRTLEGDCPAFSEYGRVNNQTYWRIRNTGTVVTSYTLTWSTGIEDSAYLQPGETSEVFYKTPSILPDQLLGECDLADDN